MKLRVVAISLIAAICVGSPAMARPSTDDEQQVRGRGARDRGEARGGAEARGGGNAGNAGDNRGGNAGESRRANGGEQRRAERRDEPEQRNASGAERQADTERRAVPRNQGRDRDNGRRNNGPVIVTRNHPNINVNIGSPYRGPRFYAPVHYDRWARQYYRWSPIGYAPWSLIYGSIGFSNFGFYGGVGPNPFYGNYGYGYGGYYGPGAYSPWQASGYDIGGIRLKIRPRDAQVFVDGYYAGIVDDFDGTFQSLRLEQGGHKIEVHMTGFEDLELDVHVQPGRTITLSEALRPRP
jgi:hypothetical protein